MLSSLNSEIFISVKLNSLLNLIFKKHFIERRNTIKFLLDASVGNVAYIEDIKLVLFNEVREVFLQQLEVEIDQAKRHVELVFCIPSMFHKIHKI